MIASIILDQITDIEVSNKARIFKAFRVIKILRIVHKVDIIKIIIDTLFLTLPSIANVGGFLLLIIYMYAVLGV